MLVTVPPKSGAEDPILLACVLSKISVFTAVAVKVEAPVTFKAPLCESCPPTVRPNVPLTVEAPKINAFVSVTLTLLPLEINKVAKLFAAFNVILFPDPAASVARPLTVIAPDCVSAPVLESVKLPTG